MSMLFKVCFEQVDQKSFLVEAKDAFTALELGKKMWTNQFSIPYYRDVIEIKPVAGKNN